MHIHDEQILMIETPAQIAQCAELYVTVFNAEPWHDQWTAASAYQRLADMYRSPGFVGFAAVAEQQIVGCIFGNIEQYYTGPYFNLKEMFVTPALQRHGIGQRLFESLDAHLQQRQIRSILLFTSNNLFPYAFYTKHGFCEIDGMRMLSRDVS